MANVHKGEVSFDANEQTYTLRYSNDALVQMEDKLNRGVVDIMLEMGSWAEDPKKIRMGFLRTLFWAGLREHHPDIDIVAAGDLITAAGGLIKVYGFIDAGIARAWPAPETKDTRPPEGGRQQNGTGQASLQSGTASVAEPEMNSGDLPRVN